LDEFINQSEQTRGLTSTPGIWGVHGELVRIATGVFQAQNSHVQARKGYGSEISKGKLIKGTIGLAESMRESNMVRCLLMSQMNGRIYNVVQRVRGSCKVTPTQSRIQRYHLLEDTNENK
jgi:hypothetical protein